MCLQPFQQIKLLQTVIDCHSSLQMHHLLNNGAEVNQADEKGFTPLHRAAYLAQYDGYLEIYEYLLVGCDALAAVALKRV